MNVIPAGRELIAHSSRGGVAAAAATLPVTRARACARATAVSIEYKSHLGLRTVNIRLIYE